MNGHQGDFMQRLLDHQRELRETVPPTGTIRRLAPSQGLIDYSLLDRMDSASELLDLARVESAEVVDAATSPLIDLQARLTAVQRDLNDARRRAYDAVLSLDDRLAEIERALAHVASQLRALE